MNEEQAARSRARARQWHRDNPERAAANQRRYREKRRIEVLTHYSEAEIPMCSCCGITEHEFLTIDHIDGGGNQHRRAMGHATIYQALLRDGLPEGFRVLCYNCNCARGHRGYCPHERSQGSVA